jgi:curli biogenesis system outer membrane secretion channel CsgG
MMAGLPIATPTQPAGAPHRVRLKAFLCLAALALLPLAPAAAQAAAAPLPAVVVWEFDNQSPPAMAALAPEAAFLRRTLAESLTAELLQVPGLPVVERQRLRDLLAEQKVGTAELADEQARVRLGRIVGAARMVFGGYFVLGSEVQVHVRVVDTATSRVLFSDESQAALASVMQQVEPMNRRLARALAGAGAGGTPNTAAARASQALWQAYDEALALADAGKLDEAVRALRVLLERDKNFSPAERQLLALLDKMARR